MSRSTHTFRRQIRLPCAHDVLERLESVQILMINNIDPYWHLQMPSPSVQNRLQEPDPLPVPTRGRPRNGPIFSSQHQNPPNTKGNRSRSQATTGLRSHDKAPGSRGGGMYVYMYVQLDLDIRISKFHKKVFLWRGILTEHTSGPCVIGT